MDDDERVEFPEYDDPPSEFRGDTTDDRVDAPGASFAYDVAREELARQEIAFRDIAGRLGFLLAATLTFGTFSFKEVNEPWRQAIFGVGLIAIMILVSLGYVPRSHIRAPDPREIAEFAEHSPNLMKWQAIGAMLAAIDGNAESLALRNRFYVVALIAGILAVIAGVGFETLSGMVNWRHQSEVHRAEHR